MAPQDAATGAGQEISQVSPTPATAPDAGSTSVPLRPQSVDIDDAEVSEDDGAVWRAAPNAEPTGTIGPIPPETIEAEAPMGDVDPLSEVKSPEAVDAAAGDEQPDVLAFEDSAIPQAPVPVELPLAGAVALALLVSYYRPTSRLGRLLNHLGPDRSNLTY